jgi:hypothetical protein
MPHRWLLILLVVGLVGVGVAVAIWFPVSVLGSPEPPRHTSAKVVRTGNCGQGMDVVSLSVDGAEKEAKLDACGHREGEQVDVVMPATVSSDTVLQTAASAPTGRPFADRLASLLLLMSAFAGGVYAYVFRYGPIRMPTLVSSPKP